MKHTIRILLACAVIATVFTFVAARPAAAGPCQVAFIIGPASGSIFGVAGHPYQGTFNSSPPLVQVIVGSGGPIGYFVAAGETLTIVDLATDCATTFFNPGDGRIDPRPGDRVVAYCNSIGNPPNLDVWGVTNDSQGHRLFSFTFADLVKAGAKGILRKVEPMGSVFAKIDASGNFFVQWFGGPAGATGNKDFAKSGVCALPAVQ